MQTSDRAYAARAMATRCFCPPDSVIPRSPISVASPSGSADKSTSSWHALTTAAYRASSNGWPKRMFSLTVALRIQALCAAYATARPAGRATVPLTWTISPRMAAQRDDLPQPVAPTIATSSPDSTRTEMSRKVGR